MSAPTLADFERVLGPGKPNGAVTKFLCPAHNDHHPSLDVEEKNGTMLWCCRAGCDKAVVTAALKERGLLGSGSSNGKRCIVKTYDYVDELARLLFQVVRYEPKDFKQRRPDGNGGWIWALDKDKDGRPLPEPTRRVLYRLPKVMAAVERGQTVWLCEGEKDVEALERAGVVATCNPHGAGKWRTEYSETLRGADELIVVADKDAPGHAHARAVAASLDGVAKSVRIVEAAEGKDAADHLAAGHGLEQFVEVDHHGIDDDADEHHDEEAEAAPGTRFRWYTSAELTKLELAVPTPVVEGLVYLQQSTAFIGQIKLSGKTTAVMDMVRCILTGEPWCGCATLWMPVYYLTEQSPASFIPQAERAGVLDLSDFHVLFHEDVLGASWEDAGTDALKATELYGPGLMVADTWGKWARFEGEQESQSGPVMQAMLVIESWKRGGNSALVSAHARKGGGSLAEALRGSTAAGGDFDVLSDIQPDKNVPRRRIIRRAGRPFAETPDDLAIYLNEQHRYVGEGAPKYARQNDKSSRLEDAIYRVLLASPKGRTEQQVVLALDEEGFGINAIGEKLKALCSDEEKPVERTRDKGNEPYTYYLRDPEQEGLL